METVVLSVHATEPEADVIARAATVLRGGGLVAFPTETVYGLGANALNAAAVGRIFAAKGRPANNPLIVHVAETAEARQVAAAWPDAAERLAARFWPGPLTVVLPRRDVVPDAVTAGGPTVAVRVPAHPVARALLQAAGVPIAAPSANRSTQLSPTRAEHVRSGLAGRIDVILDGGPTVGGLESTVLDLTRTPPRLLRPGLVTPGEIEAVVGPVARPASAAPAEDQPLLSPGMLSRHYAPRAVLRCFEQIGRERVRELAREGRLLGWLPFRGAAPKADGVRVVVMPHEPQAYAAQLYAVLHALDAAGVDEVIVELPPDTEEWLAVRDRLRRAATAC